LYYDYDGYDFYGDKFFGVEKRTSARNNNVFCLFYDVNDDRNIFASSFDLSIIDCSDMYNNLFSLAK